MPQCPQCGEGLKSHAGRMWKYFHEVAFGPYNGETYGTCPLDAMAFEQDGSVVGGSDLARKSLMETIHGSKPSIGDFDADGYYIDPSMHHLNESIMREKIRRLEGRR